MAAKAATASLRDSAEASTARLRSCTPALLFASLIALAGIACGTGRSPADRLLTEFLPFTEEWSPSRRVQAAFLTQRKDCDGNLEVLNLIHRDRVRERISLRVIWYVGPDEDSSYIRAALPEWALGTPLVPARNALSRSLIGLGHSSSPILLMLDQMNRLRLITQSPRSPREFAGLRMAIEGLTWLEGL